MLIDFHTHCFPEKIAARAIEKLSFASGGLINYTDGTAGGLKRAMADEGVTSSVVLNIATNAHQMKNVNDFAASINDKKALFAFGSVHPDAADAADELSRIREMGLLGVKFHPEYQDFFVDDEKMFPIYEKISELGLITVFHMGADYGYGGVCHCTPAALEKARNLFRGEHCTRMLLSADLASEGADAPVVAAHWGGLSMWDEVLAHLAGQKNLFIDTSFGYGQLPRESAIKIVEKHGVENMLFATDSPWHTPSLEKRFIATLGLSEGEKELLYHENAEKLLGIKR